MAGGARYVRRRPHHLVQGAYDRSVHRLSPTRRGFAIGLVLSLASVAAPIAVPAACAAAADDFARWLTGLRADALGAGIRAETFDGALDGIEPLARVIELDRAQPEVTLTFEQYMTRVASEARVVAGRQMIRENKPVLDKVAEQYGVQPRFIVALWGIESDFGRVTGGFSVIQSLATLAFDTRRGSYFRGELIAALKIIDQGNVTPAAMRGSWAGAMGQTQFMPSAYLRAAVDFDGDGRRDIWGSRPDVFASSARLLASLGWLGDQTWGREVKLPPDFDPALAGLATTKRIGDWQAIGVRLPDGGGLPTRQLDASIVVPVTGSMSPAFMVYNNYRSILRWNRSTFFAIAVGSLSDRIGDG